MAEIERWVAFHVPVNEEGEKEMEYLNYIDTSSPNIKEFFLQQKQNSLLFHLYLDFNKTFDIIIDDFEDERLKKEDVPKALEKAVAFKESADDENTKVAATKIISGDKPMFAKYVFASEVEVTPVTFALLCCSNFVECARRELIAVDVAPVSMIAFACMPFTLIFSAMILCLT